MRNRLLKATTVEDFTQLRPHLEFVDLQSGQNSAKPNIRTEHFHVMETGVASIASESGNGRVEVGIIGREGLIGATPVLLGSDRVPYDHFVHVPGFGLRIDAALHPDGDDPDAADGFRRCEPGDRGAPRPLAADVSRPRRRRASAQARVPVDDAGRAPCRCESGLQQLDGTGCIRAERGRLTVLDRQILAEMADGAYGTPEAMYARLIEGA